MIKMLATICRKPGMTRQEFFRHVKDVHGGLTIANPITVRRYVQNHVLDSAYGADKDNSYTHIDNRDLVTELYFDDIESMMQTFSSEYVRDVIKPDGPKFSDLATSIAMLTRELDDGTDGSFNSEGLTKVMYFLKKPQSISFDQYADRWHAAHDAVLRSNTMLSDTLRRSMRSLRMPEGDSIAEYFDGKGMPKFEGVASLWFSGPNPHDAFREYQRALEAQETGTHFFERSESFFLIVKEVLIM